MHRWVGGCWVWLTDGLRPLWQLGQHGALQQRYRHSIHCLTCAGLVFLQVMIAGIAAGFGLWGSMFPIDTIKSKLQADSLAKPQYQNTMDCVRQTLAQEGHAGLWRGFPAAMARAIPVNAAIFLAVEGCREMINKYEKVVEGAGMAVEAAGSAKQAA